MSTAVNRDRLLISRSDSGLQVLLFPLLAHGFLPGEPPIDVGM
jgi:hypothetical protein